MQKPIVSKPLFTAYPLKAVILPEKSIGKMHKVYRSESHDDSFFIPEAKVLAMKKKTS